MTMGHSGHDRMDRGTTNAGMYDAANLAVGAEVYGMDNEKIGNVADVGQNYFLVQKGWLFIKDLYLPTSVIARADADRVYLNVTKAQAEEMARDELPATDDAWYGTRTTDYTDDTATTTNRTMTGTDRMGETTHTGHTHAAEHTHATGETTGRTTHKGENITVPVVEEELRAGVRDVEAGRARITKNVTEEEKTINVPVEREEVYVTERAVNRPATEADLHMRDREIEIPLREQEVVTQKQATVTGEVNVRKEVRRDNEQVTDTVRREEVHVEDPNNPRFHVEGNLSDTQRRRFAAMSTDEQTRYGRMTDTERAAYDREHPWDDRNEGILDRAKDKMRGTGDQHRSH